MALVRYGGGIVDARGSVGGTTFTKTRSGPVHRSRAAGVSPRSTTQTIQRSVQSTSAKDYSYTLTDPQLAAWRTFAAANPVTNRLGNTVVMSGQQMFCKLNNNIVGVGGTRIVTPPANLNVDSITGVTLDVAHDPGGHVKVTVTRSGALANEYYVVFLTAALSSGRNYVSSQLRRIESNNGWGGVDTITSDWVAVFGSLPTAAGGRVFARVVCVNKVTGASSPGFQVSALVT